MVLLKEIIVNEHLQSKSEVATSRNEPTIEETETNEINRKNAKHGEFFFAKYLTVTGDIRESPVFVLSNEFDNNDNDVIICLCTKSPPKSDFDIRVKLKKETSVRILKLHNLKSIVKL